MLLKIPEVETGLGLGLASSSMFNGGRRKGTASCGFTSNVSVPQPPPYLQQQALSRKQRRCWTPELHRRFVDALQQLGGPGGKKTIHLAVLEVWSYLTAECVVSNLLSG